MNFLKTTVVIAVAGLCLALLGTTTANAQTIEETALNPAPGADLNVDIQLQGAVDDNMQLLCEGDTNTTLSNVTTRHGLVDFGTSLDRSPFSGPITVLNGEGFIETGAFNLFLVAQVRCDAFLSSGTANMTVAWQEVDAAHLTPLAAHFAASTHDWSANGATGVLTSFASVDPATQFAVLTTAGTFTTTTNDYAMEIDRTGVAGTYGATFRVHLIRN